MISAVTKQDYTPSVDKRTLCVSQHSWTLCLHLTARVHRFAIKAPTTNDITAHNAFAQHLFQCNEVKNFCLIYRCLWVQISVWIWPVLTRIFPVLLQSLQISGTQWLVTVTPPRCSNAFHRQLPNTHTVTASPRSLPEISFIWTVKVTGPVWSRGIQEV